MTSAILIGIAVAIAAAVFFIVDDAVIGIALGAGFYAIAHKIVTTRARAHRARRSALQPPVRRFTSTSAP